MSIQAFPLCWPAGWPRASFRVGAGFNSKSVGGSGMASKRNLTIAEGADRVMAELGRMGIRDENIVISTNVRVTVAGMPRSADGNPGDPGAAVYWHKRGGKETVMAIDQYHRLADNLAAIAATLSAMRAIERHGGAKILERAFTGFEALPAPGQTSALHWKDVLGHDIKNVEQLENAYARRRSEAHPDKGGSTDAFHDVQIAYEQARREIRA